MRAKSILKRLLPLYTLFGLAGAAVAEDRAVILIGASWCAPCRAELRRLPELARAVAPLPLELAWIDRPPPLGAAPAIPNLRVLSPERAQARHAMVAGKHPGLPLSVMVDARGRACAVRREPATAEGLRALLAAC